MTLQTPYTVHKAPKTVSKAPETVSKVLEAVTEAAKVPERKQSHDDNDKKVTLKKMKDYFLLVINQFQILKTFYI